MDRPSATLLNRLAALNALPQLDAELIATVFGASVRAVVRSGSDPQLTASNWLSPVWQTVPFSLSDVAEQTASCLEAPRRSWLGRLAARWLFAASRQPDQGHTSTPEPLFQALELRQHISERQRALLIAKANPHARLTRCAVAPRLGLARVPLLILVSWFRDTPLTAEDVFIGANDRRFRLCWRSDPAQTHWYCDRLVVDATGLPGSYDDVLNAAPHREVHVGGAFSIPWRQPHVAMATSFPHGAPPHRLRASGATMRDVFKEAAGDRWAAATDVAQPDAKSKLPCAQCPYEPDRP